MSHLNTSLSLQEVQALNNLTDDKCYQPSGLKQNAAITGIQLASIAGNEYLGNVGISFYGNVDVAVLTGSLDPVPSNNVILLYAPKIRPCPWTVTYQSISSPNQQPSNAKIVFTAPPIEELLFDLAPGWIRSQASITFEVKIFVQSRNAKGGIDYIRLIQAGSRYSMLTYTRDYTPVCYYLSPRALYKDSEFSIFCDPKGTIQFKSPDAIKAYVDGTQQDLASRGTDPNLVALVNGAVNEIKAKATTQFAKADGVFTMQFSGGQAKLMTLVSVCMPLNDGCYDVKTLPKIESISHTQGYKTGGQKLTITGWGFKEGATSVIIQKDAQTQSRCIVQSVTNTRITCKTEGVTAPTLPGTFVGAPGILRRIYKGYGVQPTYANFETSPTTIKMIDEQIYTTIENSQNIADTFLTQYVGFFVPQVTASYRFFLACDDTARVYLGTDQNKPATHTFELASYTSYRNFRSNVGVSAWIDHVKDQPYYLEVLHVEGSGGDHVSLGMEIKLNNGEVSINHPQATKEVQQLVINQTLNYDHIKWEIFWEAGQLNDVGNYTIIFKNEDRPGTILDNGLTGRFEFNVTDSAAQICAQIQGPIYQQTLASDAVCTVTRLNANNITTSTWATTRKVIVQVRATKFISSNAIKDLIYQDPVVVAKRTLARFEPFRSGWDGAQIGRPLSGKFVIQCATKTGVSAITAPIAVSASSASIKAAIILVCTDLAYDITVTEGGSFSGIVLNGRDIIIKFTPAIDFLQFNISTSSIDPIIAGQSLSTIAVSYQSLTTIQYSANILFYDQIPVEFLKTRQAAPQLKVVVDGQEAICGTKSCDFQYILPPAECQTVNVNGQHCHVTCTGTGSGSGGSGNTFPTSCSTAIGTAYCIESTTGATIYDCNLNGVIPTGTNNVDIQCELGGIPYTGSPIVVDITITSLSPTEVNRLGGQNLIITGQNFPSTLVNQVVTVTYGGSTCNPIAITQTTITCETGPVAAATPNSGPRQQVTVCINTYCANNLDIGILGAPNTATGFYPNPVSPVLRTNMFITFANVFLAFNVNDYQVRYHSIADPTYIRKVAIKELINGNQWRLRFLGAYAGKYEIRIKHITLGYLDTTALPQVDANSYINSFDPKTGSTAGGTQITITGGPFSNNGLENNVMIGNANCIVFYSTPTTIKCQIESTDNHAHDGDSQDLFVFLKAAEYAVCNLPGGVCSFTWSNAGGSSVDSAVTSYNSTQGYYITTITGSFPGASSLLAGTCPVVTCNGQSQVLLFCDETMVQVKVIGATQFSSCSIGTLQGAPPNAQTIVSSSVSTSGNTPVFSSLNVNIGSPGGSYITAKISGIDLYATGHRLLLASGTELCQAGTYKYVASTETLECKTNPGVIGITNVKYNVNSVDYLCVNTNTPAVCRYQTSSTTMPQILGNTISTDHKQILITGAYFNLFLAADWQPICSFAGVLSESVTVTGNTATCNYNNYGVPFVGAPEKVVFYFQSKTSTIAHWATVALGKELDNPITDGIISISPNNLQCGLGGGCLLTIQNTGYPGLTSALRALDVKILVCGQECVFQPLLSDIDTTVCALPAIQNQHSCEDDKIKEQKEKKHKCHGKKNGGLHCKLEGDITGSNKQEAGKCFDDSRDPDYKKASHQSNENSNSYGRDSKRLRMLTQNYEKDEQDKHNEEVKQKEKEDKKEATYEYNENSNGWTDTKGNCYLGQKFGKGVLAAVSEVKFFISPIKFNAALYDGDLFQGSNNGVSWTTIFTIHKKDLQHSWNTYELDTEQKFNQYRFLGTKTAGSCTFGKVKLIGYEIVTKTKKDKDCNCDVPDDTPTTNGYLSCSVSIDWGTNQVPTEIIGEGGNNGGYDPNLTPVCNDISPKYGTVKGGTIVTITGNNFSPFATDYFIKFDNIECVVQSATANSVTCLTGRRPGLWDAPQTLLRILGKGEFICGDEFTYVYPWSDEDTWGGDGQPDDYESVWVPAGLVLLVDIPNSPPLKEVIVEGGLIFDVYQPCTATPNSFDAYWIFANGGNIAIGYEDLPYPCKLTITLHGDRLTPEVPLFGNEVIGVRYGTLNIHGQHRLPPWVDLQFTAQAGDSIIYLNDQVDWNVGEEIVIASTSYDLNEAEVRTIAIIDRITDVKHPKITLNLPLTYKHFAAVEDCLSGAVEMRGEVGLLTRNIVIQGDANSPNDENGAVISAYSVGDDSSIVKIEYVELRQMGQAYKLGRYPIHLRVLGKMSASYIRGNSLRQSYNRFIAVHTNSLLIEWNVAFEVKGHAIFIEDGSEQDNVINKNLIINTRISWSLQNTDQTPATYFIQNPKNTFTGNRAAGSEGYGFWFNLPTVLAGINNNPGICPSATKLGLFDDNAAHTSQRDGLKQIATYHPRETACSPIDATNPPVTANLNKFKSWKNRGDGATFDRVGDVRTTNFQGADNLGAGIEYSLTDLTDDGTAQINTATLVGFSLGNSEHLEQQNNQYGWGVQTARTENFQVRNVKFCNFDKNGYAAIKTCSNCDVHYTLTDSGARTTTFEGLQFNLQVPRYINYTWPYNAILYDLDNSLTGYIGGWATPYWKHNDQQECHLESVKYNGLVCDNTVQVRRIAFNNYLPSYFDWADLKILRYDLFLSQQTPAISSVFDYSATATPSSLVDYILYDQVPADYSVFPFKQYTLPTNAWAVPFVTGKTYKIHWRSGIDFTRFTFELSPKWKFEDKQITLIFNHTEVRETILVDITTKSPAVRVPRDSLATKPLSTDWLTGDHRLWNQTEVRQLHVIANGRNATRKQVTLYGYNCLLWCPNYGPKDSDGPNGEAPCPGLKYWSIPASWENGKVPQTGDDVYIRRNCVYIYDFVGATAILNSLIVEGTLIWDKLDILILNTKFFFIRGGFVLIGNSTTEYFTGQKAEIVLHGNQSEQYLAFSTWIEAGGKVLAVAGELRMFGEPRQRRARLLAPAVKGESTIYVSQPSGGLNWRANDMLTLAATNNDWRSAEHVKILEFNQATGSVTLAAPLLHNHYGASDTSHYGTDLDARGEVYLMTSNVKISGKDTDSWGGAIVVSDYKERDGKPRNGTVLFDNVEVYNCSQYDTFKAAIRFESNGIKESHVTNSVFRHGLGKGLQILNSKNVFLEDNIFFDFRQWGGNIQTSSQITLDGNVFFHIGVRYTQQAAPQIIPPNGGLLVCAYRADDKCSNLKIINNIVSGAYYAGFGVAGSDCQNSVINKDAAWFKANIAHSNNGDGAIFFPDPNRAATHINCFQAITFTAYKNRGYGAISYATSKKIIFSDMVLIDNYVNAAVQSGYGTEPNDDETKQRIISYSNVKFYGDSPILRDCDIQDACAADITTCQDRAALLLSAFTTKSNTPFPRDLSAYDEIYSDQIWNGLATYDEVSFIDYLEPKTFCGGRQSLFKTHRNATDYYPIQRFSKTNLLRVKDTVFGGYWQDPNPQWAVVEKCGNFPCSGPKNIILRFESTYVPIESVFTNINTPLTNLFYIISNNAAVGPQSGCVRVDAWNGYYCRPDEGEIAQLIFESLDSDKFTRTFSPVNISTSSLPANPKPFYNILNSFSDKGFTLYGGQQRRTRFASIVKTGQGFKYNVSYTGTVPQQQRFRLDGSELKGFVVSIQYTEQNSYAVSADIRGGLVDYNAWDTTNRIMKPVSDNGLCGENRYIAVLNVLEFMIRPGCTITLAPRNVIMASVRLEWTVDEFYSSGGTTLFIDRISAALGVHPSTVKIVTVMQGSVVVKYNIQNPTTDKAVLPAIKAKLDAVMKVGATFLGAPILDYDASFPVPQDDVVVPEGKPVVVNNTKPIIISQNLTVTEDTTAPVMTKEQVAKLVIIVGSVLGVCVAVSIIVWCICRKRKGDVIAIHVQAKGDSTTKQGINISQEFDTQYHPKSELGKVFDFDELEKKKKAKAIEDEVDDMEGVEQENQKATEQEEEWRQDWNTDTVRTNANRYTDENYLMNSPNGAKQLSMDFAKEVNRNSDVQVDHESAPSTSQVKDQSSEIYIDTE